MDDLRLEIDEYALDHEWVEQPLLAMHWGRQHADAVLALDEAKARLDLVKGELDLDMRLNPSDYGLPKMTEAVIANAIPATPKYQGAVRAVSQAKHAVNVLAAAVNAIEHRKRALEKLVDLDSRDYHSTPRAPEGAAERMEEQEKAYIRGRGRKRRKEREAQRDD